MRDWENEVPAKAIVMATNTTAIMKSVTKQSDERYDGSIRIPVGDGEGPASRSESFD